MENETDPPAQLENETDPLAQFGLDAIDLRWTLKDIAAERSLMVNKQHLPQLIGTHPTRDALRTNGLIVENSTYGQPYDQCAQST